MEARSNDLRGEETRRREFYERVNLAKLFCTRCRQAWLAIGAKKSDEQICKSCGHKLVTM